MPEMNWIAPTERSENAMTGSLQLCDYPADVVRLSCPKCGRDGQYRKQNLDLALPGEMIAGPSVVESPTAPRAMARKGESRNPSPASQTRDNKFRGFDRRHKIVLQNEGDLIGPRRGGVSDLGTARSARCKASALAEPRGCIL